MAKRKKKEEERNESKQKKEAKKTWRENVKERKKLEKHSYIVAHHLQPILWTQTHLSALSLALS